MQKTAICFGMGLAALVQCGAVQAQSNVTVYGVMDVFAEWGEAGTKAAPVKQYRIQTGGANGSRLGFRGTEDLGGGLKANFVLEHGLIVDTGTPASSSSFWNRQVFVGLSNDLGSLTAGRHYSPLLTHQDTFDPALSTTGYGSAYNSGVMRFISRVNNSVLYKTPVWGGFSGAMMLAAGEGTAGKTHSGSIKYDKGMFSGGAAYGITEGLDATKEDKSIWNIAGSLKIGSAATLMAAVQHTRNDSQALNVQDNRSEFMLGGVYTFGVNELHLSYGQGKIARVSDSTSRHTSLGYIYNLSKRTALYAAVQSVDNPTNTGYRGTNGFTFDAIEGGLPAGAGVHARAVALGMRTRF